MHSFHLHTAVIGEDINLRQAWHATVRSSNSGPVNIANQMCITALMHGTRLIPGTTDFAISLLRNRPPGTHRRRFAFVLKHLPGCISLCLSIYGMEYWLGRACPKWPI